MRFGVLSRLDESSDRIYTVLWSCEIVSVGDLCHLPLNENRNETWDGGFEGKCPLSTSFHLMGLRYGYVGHGLCLP